MSSGFIKTAFREMMKGVCTNVPGHILTYEPALQRAQVQIGVEVVAASGYTDQLPPISDVPVLFLGGTQYSVIHQINPGDEGLILFSQRCIDGWKQTGGVANNPLARFHDAHDAFFIPGFRPLPTRISGFANDGIRLQSRDGGVHVWVKSSGEIVATNGAATFQMLPSGDVVINGACVIKPDGTIEAPNVTFGGISGNSHRHPGDSGGNTGGPIN